MSDPALGHRSIILHAPTTVTEGADRIAASHPKSPLMLARRSNACG
ncbi:hypothetical protein ACXHXM_06100|nr:hypothetical protein [Rhizobium altiplani]